MITSIQKKDVSRCLNWPLQGTVNLNLRPKKGNLRRKFESADRVFNGFVSKLSLLDVIVFSRY